MPRCPRIGARATVGDAWTHPVPRPTWPTCLTGLTTGFAACTKKTESCGPDATPATMLPFFDRSSTVEIGGNANALCLSSLRVPVGLTRLSSPPFHAAFPRRRRTQKQRANLTGRSLNDAYGRCSALVSLSLLTPRSALYTTVRLPYVAHRQRAQNLFNFLVAGPGVEPGAVGL
jgi:hypothetical protein